MKNNFPLYLQLQELENSLLPRRKEILMLIRDHSPISFDQIHRRFMAVTTSTLHYDLQQLHKVGLIRKLGTTKSAQYQTI